MIPKPTLSLLNSVRHLPPSEWHQHGIEYRSVTMIHGKAVSGQLADGRRFSTNQETKLFTFYK